MGIATPGAGVSTGHYYPLCGRGAKAKVKVAVEVQEVPEVPKVQEMLEVQEMPEVQEVQGVQGVQGVQTCSRAISLLANSSWRRSECASAAWLGGGVAW